MKRVFIIHGWDGNPELDFLPWLGKELEKKGFEVHIPAMPDSDNPRIKAWVSALKKAVGTPDENTYFVGHSIGCQTILRYLESLPKTAKVGGVLFVAGWFSLQNLETDEEKELAKLWLECPINLKLVSQKTKNMIAIFSDNDPFVPLAENEKIFRKFCRKIIVEKNKGHFTSREDNIIALPSALNAVLELAKV